MRRYAALLDAQAPEILFLTSSDASDSLADAGFAAFKIPSKTVARKTELNKLEYRRLAKHFVWNTLGVFTPDLLVVDTFPSGSFDELFQVLDGPFKSSFVYRNVNADYASRATFRSAVQMYDQVVAPHAKSEASRGGFAAHDGDLTFSGEVVQFEQEDLLPAQAAREQLGIADDKKLVYVSAGGGGDPNAQATLQSLVDSFTALEDVHLSVGAGPLYRGPRMAEDNVTWFDGPSVAKYFAGLDAAVSAAGYNTFHELIYTRVPTAFYAQAKVADDQADRIDAASEAGACCVLADVSDEAAVRHVVQDLLKEDVAAQMRTACEKWLPTNGASRCAIALLQPLYNKERLQWAQAVLTPSLSHALETLSDSSAIAGQWLGPLLPIDQVQAVSDHVGIDAIVKQLSASAADEVQRAISGQLATGDLATIQSALLSFVDCLQRFTEQQRKPMADAALKTILATMKKQPLSGELENRWVPWVVSIIDAVKTLIALGSTTENTADTVIDRLRLFRAFPRIVDTDVRASAECFQQFLSDQQRSGRAVHEIEKSIQLLKLTHSRVTRASLDELSAQKTSRDRSEQTQW